MCAGVARIPEPLRAAGFPIEMSHTLRAPMFGTLPVGEDKAAPPTKKQVDHHPAKRASIELQVKKFGISHLLSLIAARRLGNLHRALRTTLSAPFLLPYRT